MSETSDIRHALILAHGTPEAGCEKAAIDLQARILAHAEERKAAGPVTLAGRAGVYRESVAALGG